VELFGETVETALAHAQAAQERTGMRVLNSSNILSIEAYGSITLEILNNLDIPIDFIIVPVGAGNLLAGISLSMQQFSPETVVIGVENEEVPAMSAALKADRVVTLPPNLSKYCDGTAYQQVGELAFSIVQKAGHEVVTVPEGKISTTIL